MKEVEWARLKAHELRALANDKTVVILAVKVFARVSMCEIELANQRVTRDRVFGIPACTSIVFIFTGNTQF